MDDSISRINSFIDNDSILDDTTAANISLDCNAIKLKCYEEQINKLIVDNKQLRNQLSRLAEETKEQEDKFMQIFLEASEERRKQDEKSQLKHKALLQQYYEAFVQLEDENKLLKKNLHETIEKLKQFEDTDKSESYKPEEKKSKLNEIDNSPSQISLSILNEKDAEIQELKNEIKNLKSENETLNSMKNLIDDKMKLETKVKEEEEEVERSIFNEKTNDLEVEKSVLANKLKNTEASLTRWILKACDSQTELDRLKNDYRNLIEVNKRLNEFIQNTNENQTKLELMTQKYEDEAKKSSKLQLKLDENKDELNKLNSTITIQKNEIEKLKTEFKTSQINLEKKHQNEVANNKSKVDKLNDKIVELNEQLKQKDLKIIKLESAQDDAQTLECELKLRTYENKSTADKLNQMNSQLNESKKQLEALKQENSKLISDNEALNHKIKLLTSENQVLKTKFDSNLLEKNSLKCKYEELLRESASQTSNTKPQITTKKLNAKTQTHAAQIVDQIIQTDDFNYDFIIIPLKEEFEAKLKQYIHTEILSKNEIEQLKYRLKKNEEQMVRVNESLKEQFKLNSEMRERNDFLMEKCNKLKLENDNQLKDFGNIRYTYECDRAIWESTESQYKKFIDYITNSHPDLIKKFMKK